jgi:hypothetical protein
MVLKSNWDDTELGETLVSLLVISPDPFELPALSFASKETLCRLIFLGFIKILFSPFQVLKKSCKVLISIFLLRKNCVLSESGIFNGFGTLTSILFKKATSRKIQLNRHYLEIIFLLNLDL